MNYEDNKQQLEQAYTGIWGTKVFWLAAFTLFPILVGLKIETVRLDVSIATIIYTIYHGFGIYNWITVRQLTREADRFSTERASNYWAAVLRRHRKTEPLSWSVILLLVLTFFAKANVVWRESEPLSLPEAIYYILGVPAPEETECTKLKIKYEYVANNVNIAPCRNYDSAIVVPVRSIQEKAQKCPEGGSAVCVVAPDVEPDPDKLRPLWDDIWTRIYPEVNQELFSHFEQSADDISSGRGHNLLLLIQAPAGSGKSWIFRGLYKENKSRKTDGEHGIHYMHNVNHDVWIRQIDLKNKYEGHSSADLILDGKVVNTLYGVATTEAERQSSRNIIRDILADYRDGGDRQILVLDSIDELHPGTRNVIFQEIYDFLEMEYEHPRHIYILGRPEALSISARASDVKFDIDRLALKFPLYSTIDKVASRWNNQVIYRWMENRIRPVNNASFEDVILLMKTSPTICSSFSHLIISAWVIEQGGAWVRDGRTMLSEEKLQEEIFDLLLKRNKVTHGRPGMKESGYVELFEIFLMEYLEYKNGDMFKIPFGARLGRGEESPLAQAVLHHSGLIDIDPVDAEFYRFSPSWIPLQLLRRRANRVGCSLPRLTRQGTLESSYWCDVLVALLALAILTGLPMIFQWYRLRSNAVSERLRGDEGRI